VLVPNGFNTESFKPDPAAHPSVRAELGLSPHAILIGRFGRNSAMKDYPTFIEAMKLVPNAHAIIAGVGTHELAVTSVLKGRDNKAQGETLGSAPASTEPCTGETTLPSRPTDACLAPSGLQTSSSQTQGSTLGCDVPPLQGSETNPPTPSSDLQSRTSAIQHPRSSIQSPAPNVHILDERHDLPRLTAALDIACSSSAFGEGFPNVVAEAMCSSVPCVVTDVGDSSWLLQDAGRVVPPSDARALAVALNELIAMPSHERLALGQRGRQRIMDHFSLPAVVSQFESLLSAVHPSSLILHPSSPCVA
jgi:glycosyltransferase involved in cell wall biosynthesis